MGKGATLQSSSSGALPGQSESRGQVHGKRKERSATSNVRYAIRVLQEIPLVLSLAVFVNYFSELIDIDISMYEYPIFGFSIYLLIRLFLSARKLYVSTWSLILYVTLIIVACVDFADSIFKLTDKVLYLQEIMDTLFTAGVFSSFLTFIYMKFKG